MKKVLLVLVLFALIGAGTAFAQDSSLYVRTIYITKVYPHNLGYKVIYSTGTFEQEEAYIPLEWFKSTNGKGMIIYGDDPGYPYMSVYWENGEFSHVKLYVNKSINHVSWGSLNTDVDLTEEFNVESLELKF